MEELFESVYNMSLLNEDRSVSLYYIGRRHSDRDEWQIANIPYQGIELAKEALAKMKSKSQTFMFKIFGENDPLVLEQTGETAL